MNETGEPVPTKRFELATNPEARTRLDNFRDGVKTFQKERSEVLGATVFGSMIKGDKANAESDIDGFLYIDAETIPDKDKLKNPKQTEDEYRQDLLTELKVPPEEQSQYYGDFIPQLLSGEVLDSEISSYTKAYTEREIYKVKTSVDEDEENPMSREDKEKLHGSMPDMAMLSSPIGGMFHAKVGHGIDKYRRIFLEKIVALPSPEMAKEIWNSIYAQLSTMEGRWAEGKSVRLPATLEEALQTYHPELLRRISAEGDQEKVAKLREGLFDQFDQ